MVEITLLELEVELPDAEFNAPFSGSRVPSLLGGADDADADADDDEGDGAAAPVAPVGGGRVDRPSGNAVAVVLSALAIAAVAWLVSRYRRSVPPTLDSDRVPIS